MKGVNTLSRKNSLHFVVGPGGWRLQIHLGCALKSKLEDRSLGIAKPEPQVEGKGEVNYCLLWDDGFVLKPWLMKPFSRRALTRNERIYNYRISTNRRVEKKSFGILSNQYIEF